MRAQSNRRCGARLKDRDLRVAVCPLVDQARGRPARRPRPSRPPRRRKAHSARAILPRRARRAPVRPGPRRKADRGRRARTGRLSGAEPSFVASARQMRVTPPSASASTLARRSARASAPVVDEQREPRAARKSLDRERPRSREQVNDPRALDLAGETVLENVEDRLAQALRGRTNGARRWRQQRAALEAAADDPHRSRLSRRPARAAGAFRRSFPRGLGRSPVRSDRAAVRLCRRARRGSAADLRHALLRAAVLT